LSLYCEITQFTGGEDRVTVRYGDAWSLAEGLPHLIKLPPRRKTVRLLRQKAAQKETRRPGSFLPGFHAALRRYYDPRESYLTPKGTVVFYPACTVAPYEAGIIELIAA